MDFFARALKNFSLYDSRDWEDRTPQKSGPAYVPMLFKEDIAYRAANSMSVHNIRAPLRRITLGVASKSVPAPISCKILGSAGIRDLYFDQNPCVFFLPAL